MSRPTSKLKHFANLAQCIKNEDELQIPVATVSSSDKKDRYQHLTQYFATGTGGFSRNHQYSHREEDYRAKSHTSQRSDNKYTAHDSLTNIASARGVAAPIPKQANSVGGRGAAGLLGVCKQNSHSTMLLQPKQHHLFQESVQSYDQN